jgi:hypothetical protein
MHTSCKNRSACTPENPTANARAAVEGRSRSSTNPIKNVATAMVIHRAEGYRMVDKADDVDDSELQDADVMTTDLVTSS